MEFRRKKQHETATYQTFLEYREFLPAEKKSLRVTFSHIFSSSIRFRGCTFILVDSIPFVMFLLGVWRTLGGIT